MRAWFIVRLLQRLRLRLQRITGTAISDRYRTGLARIVRVNPTRQWLRQICPASPV